MKNKIIFLSVFLITVSLILCLSGCSCLVVLAAAGDPNTYKGNILELKLDSVPPGREVVVYLADGKRIRGEYIGLDSLPEEKTPEAEEIKTPFLTAIAVEDTLGKNIIPVDEVEQIEVKAKRVNFGKALTIALVTDAVILVGTVCTALLVALNIGYR